MMHVFPIGDEREHDPETGEAYAVALVIHHAADHREIIEEAERILSNVKRDGRL